jgi:hypothetical protein
MYNTVQPAEIPAFDLVAVLADKLQITPKQAGEFLVGVLTVALTCDTAALLPQDVMRLFIATGQCPRRYFVESVVMHVLASRLGHMPPAFAAPLDPALPALH